MHKPNFLFIIVKPTQWAARKVNKQNFYINITITIIIYHMYTIRSMASTSIIHNK